MDTTLVDEKLKEIYLSYRTIAIVGASPDSKKTSNIIMKYLRNTGRSWVQRLSFALAPKHPWLHQILTFSNMS